MSKTRSLSWPGKAAWSLLFAVGFTPSAQWLLIPLISDVGFHTWRRFEFRWVPRLLFVTINAAGHNFHRDSCAGELWYEIVVHWSCPEIKTPAEIFNIPESNKLLLDETLWLRTVAVKVLLLHQITSILLYCIVVLVDDSRFHCQQCGLD